MTPRDTATIAELEIQRSFLGSRAANLAGEAAELKAALQAAQARIAELEKAASVDDHG